MRTVKPRSWQNGVQDISQLSLALHWMAMFIFISSHRHQGVFSGSPSSSYSSAPPFLSVVTILPVWNRARQVDREVFARVLSPSRPFLLPHSQQDSRALHYLTLGPSSKPSGSLENRTPDCVRGIPGDRAVGRRQARRGRPGCWPSSWALFSGGSGGRGANCEPSTLSVNVFITNLQFTKNSNPTSGSSSTVRWSFSK